MSTEHDTQHEITTLHELYEQPSAPDYSDPNSAELDALLDEANGSVIIASRLLLDRMVSGEIR